MSDQQAAIWQLSDELVTVPTLPAIDSQVNDLVADQNSSAAEVAVVIQSDVAIATKVLRLANSAYYGLRSKVNSVQHAVAMLGFNIIKNLAITATVFENLEGGKVHPLFNHEQFWKHSVASGLICRLLADKLGMGRKDIEGLFICGLLHDVGKIVLEEHLHEKFIECLDVSGSENIPLVEAEQKVLDFTHGDVGAVLADRWHLAPEIIVGAQFHHKPMEAPADGQMVACVTHVADFICRLRPVGHGGGAVHPRLVEEAWQALGLGTGVIEPLIRELDETVQTDAMMTAG